MLSVLRPKSHESRETERRIAIFCTFRTQSHAAPERALRAVQATWTGEHGYLARRRTIPAALRLRPRRLVLVVVPAAALEADTLRSTACSNPCPIARLGNRMLSGVCNRYGMDATCNTAAQHNNTCNTVATHDVTRSWLVVSL